MATIKEDYVSFETAKLLKEKGFPLPSTNFEDWVFCMYDENGDIQWGCYHQDYYARVTLQMAMKWLREVHKLFITIEIKGDPRMESFIYYKWTVAKYSSCQIERVDNGLHTPEDYWYAKGEEDETYEQACEAAIKYCLENLI